MRLFDEATLRKLDRLALVASKVRSGQIKGERRSTKRGTSIEFADYRNYTPGDDLRRLDWNVYARSDRPFVKLMHEEEDLAVQVLVDASQSMRWGEGDADKFTYAQRLAAALGYIALATGDRLTVAFLRADGRPSQYGPARGRGHSLRLLDFVGAQTPSGSTDLNAALRQYVEAAKRPGLVFLISDLFSPAGYREGLLMLQSRGSEINLLHLLAPDELEPQLAGDLQLVDVETGQTQDVTVDGSLRQMYRRRLQSWQDEIRTHCRRRDMRYLPIVTRTPWDECVLYEFRRTGVVK